MTLKKLIILITVFITLSIVLAFFLTKKNQEHINDKSLLTGRWSKFVHPQIQSNQPDKILEFINFFEKDEQGKDILIVRTLDIVKKEQIGYLKAWIKNIDETHKTLTLSTLISDGTFIFSQEWDNKIQDFMIKYEMKNHGNPKHLILSFGTPNIQELKKIGDFIKDKS